jgi:DNA polymerase alpha subunit A
LQIKEKAVKVLANSIYGYLGYQHSRFQAKKLAALVTEQGRFILKSTEEAIRNEGYEVIYGDTDSVMFDSRVSDPSEANAKAEKLAIYISKRYNFLRLAVDFIFVKMLLVQKKKYAALVWNSRTNTTRIERKGLDMVRRDWSEQTKSMSEFVIQQFMAGSGANGRDGAINTIITELEVVSEMLRNSGSKVERPSLSHPDGLVIDDLVILKALKKNLDQYPDNDALPHVSVARLMASRGEAISQNMTIKYVICKCDDRELGKKARPPEDVVEFADADVEWYLSNQLLHPLWRLCEPFGGMDMSMISRALGLQTASSLTAEFARHGERDGGAADLIPRICELGYQCRGCGQTITIRAGSANWFRYVVCDFVHSPKFVANQLAFFVRDFAGKPQRLKCDGYLCDYESPDIPVFAKYAVHNNMYRDSKACRGLLQPALLTVDLFNTLRYFVELFRKGKTVESEVEAKFREEMFEIANAVLQMHPFAKVSFRSLFQPLQAAGETEADAEGGGVGRDPELVDLDDNGQFDSDDD